PRGQGGVRERTPAYELGAGGGQAVQVVAVVEGEGGVAGDRDAQARRERRRLGRERGRLPHLALRQPAGEVPGIARGRGETALLPSSPSPVTPSKSPIIPSTTATSRPPAARQKMRRFSSAGSIHASSVRDTTPHTASWCPGSMKSGPTLKGWTRSPRSRSAARSASVTVVLPTPLAVPATMRAFMDAGRNFRPAGRAAAG